MRKATTREDVIRGIRKVAKKLGRAPRKCEFHAHAGITEHFLARHFLTWNDALIASGQQTYFKIPSGDDALLEDWGKVVRKIGPYPSKARHDAEGEFSAYAISRRFGAWRNLPEIFRAFAGERAEWRDVLAKMDEHDGRLAQLGTRVLRSKVVRAIRGTAGNEMRRLRLGTLGNEMPTEHEPETGVGSRRLRVGTAGEDAPAALACGDPIDFAMLRNAPVNENGVILLFGMVAKQLGFLIEAVQIGFPDCEAKQKCADGKWRRLRIEFEFESKNFVTHGHETDGCDVIVCWRHNWAACPIQVIELEKEIHRLRREGDGARRVA